MAISGFENQWSPFGIIEIKRRYSFQFNERLQIDLHAWADAELIRRAGISIIFSLEVGSRVAIECCINVNL